MNEMKIVFMDDTEKTYSIKEFWMDGNFIVLQGRFKRNAFRQSRILSYEYIDKDAMKKEGIKE